MDQTNNMPLDNELYRTLLDNLYEGVYFVSSDRTIVYWNEAAERMTGFDKSELLNVHVDCNPLAMPTLLTTCTAHVQIHDSSLVHSRGKWFHAILDAMIALF